MYIFKVVTTAIGCSMFIFNSLIFSSKQTSYIFPLSKKYSQTVSR